ncbi:MAG: hypothetical protein MJ198_07675 [Bacteroidales bacterium]|nr:hypothetical protein [Bacteroidales bacterium]
MRQGLLGRIKQPKQIRQFAKEHKNDTVVFFHSASVGEWEQSIPIIKTLKQQSPQIKVVASFFSPSGMNHAKKENVDLSIYLPFDFVFSNYLFFKRIQPKAWIVSKYDIWPGILLAAHWANVPVLLCSAELAKDSLRYKGLNAVINRLFYKYITYILPVSEDYKERFKNIFPYEERLEVVGDARYDQIIAKAEAVKMQPNVELFENPLPVTFIGGSLWPADEKHLFPALLQVFKEHDDLQLVLVPHELHESHIQAIEQTFASEGIETQRYSDFSQSETKKTSCRVAIVNTVGMLAKLYKNTDIAYVGGAFSTGVHNVAEPSAFANPVIYGPKHVNSYEAMQLKEVAGGFPINNQEECYKVLSKLVNDEQFRKEAGKKNHDFLYASKGASDKIIKHVLEFL